jgi:S-methylmethionine-dependent homocysteine/selenocysteine methylase
VLEHPEVVTQLHRDFVHAGSDVVEALTYYAHREKLRVIGREKDLEPINRRALEIAKAVAMESGALFAGDICNTNVYDAADPASHKAVRAMFEEQVGWASDAGVDYVVGETFSWAQEALIALDVIKRANKAAVITLAMHKADVTRENWSVGDACKRLADAGADVVGLNCIRGPETMMPLLRAIRASVKTHMAALPVPYRTHESEPSFQSLRDTHWHSTRAAARSRRARPVHLQPLRDRGVRPRALALGHPLPRRVLRRRPASHPRAGRGRRQAPAGQQVLAGHVEARVPRLARADQAGAEGLRRQAVERPG